MGNSVNQQEVKIFIDEMSETSDVNDNFLKEDCSNFLKDHGRLLLDKYFESSFVAYFVNLKEIQILNFIKNTTKYLKFEIEGDSSKNIKFTIDLIYLILQAVYKKYNNFRDLFYFAVQETIESTSLNEDTCTEKHLDIFPLNIIKIIVNYINEHILSNKNNDNPVKEFELKYSLIRIIFFIIFYQKSNDFLGKNYVEYFDPIKIIFEKILDKQSINKFFSFLFYGFCNGISLIFTFKTEKGIRKEDFENYVKILLNITVFFIFDINKFFFVPLKEKEFDEVCFENEYNEKIFKYLMNQVYPKEKINDIIKDYNDNYQNNFISVLEYNNQVLNEFIISFFSNYEKFNINYRKLIKIMIIYFFEVYENYSELLCLNKDFISIIIEKLSFNEFLDLILYNKITTCKNFYLMTKYMDEYNCIDHKKLSKIVILCEKCFDYLLINKKGQLKMDHMTYYLMLIINNLSLYILSLNDTVLLKLGELIENLALLEIKFDNYYDHLILTKTTLEIIVNFVFNIEFPAGLILQILKFNHLLSNINERIRKYNESNPSLTSDNEFKEYCDLFDLIQRIIIKFKNRIEQEGANVKFTQNTEILKIINKISIGKNENEYKKKFKENQVFNTDTEKHIILTIYLMDCENEDLFKK